MRAAVLTLPIALVLALTGCGDGEEGSATTTASGTTVSSTTAPEETTQPTSATDEPEDEAAGGEEETGGVAADSPGADPESALEAFFVSGDPDLVCGELATESLLAAAYGDEAGCRAAQAPGATAESIEVVSLEESGDDAEAVVIPEGGPNDGFEHEVVLVREGDSWLVDSLEADIPAGP